MSDVPGLDHFTQFFEDYKDQYVLIGGAATYLLLNNASIPFTRVTKDLDIVIIVEALSIDFIKKFWEYIRFGQYTCRSPEDKDRLYRFSKPKNEVVPKMIEILSRKPDILRDIPINIRTRLAVDNKMVSLSAIILEQDYYSMIIDSKSYIDKLYIVDTLCLIALKIKAYLNLSVELSHDRYDLEKHRDDVFSLTQILTGYDKKSVSEGIHLDIQNFIQIFRDNDWQISNIGLSGNKENYLKTIEDSFTKKMALD